MKLQEEFKLYETMWEDEQPLKEEVPEFRSEYARLMSTPEGREKFKAMSSDEKVKLYKEDNEADPVQQILDKASAIEFDYSGFSEDNFEDKWNDISGHYTVDWVDTFGDFTYEVDAVTVFEDIRDDMIPTYLNKVKQSELVTECKKVYDAWYNSTEDTEEAAGEAFELFVAKNLEDLALLFEGYLLVKYAEDAREWARMNLEPIDPRDWY